jgi:hypothetical protein
MRRFRGLALALVGAAAALWASMSLAAPMGRATWGNPNQRWGTRRPVTAADRVLVACYRSGHLTLETDFTDPVVLKSQWTLQSDDRPDLKSRRLPANVVSMPGGLQLRTTATTACHARWATGGMISKARQRYGLFEVSIQTADIPGLNNAFRLVSDAQSSPAAAPVHHDPLAA